MERSITHLLVVEGCFLAHWSSGFLPSDEFRHIWIDGKCTRATPHAPTAEVRSLDEIIKRWSIGVWKLVLTKAERYLKVIVFEVELGDGNSETVRGFLIFLVLGEGIFLR